MWTHQAYDVCRVQLCMAASKRALHLEPQADLGNTAAHASFKHNRFVILNRRMCLLCSALAPLSAPRVASPELTSKQLSCRHMAVRCMPSARRNCNSCVQEAIRAPPCGAKVSDCWRSQEMQQLRWVRRGTQDATCMLRNGMSGWMHDE